MGKPVLIYAILILGVFWFSTSEAQIIFPPNDDVLQNYGRCITPNRERALCINLMDCKFLYNIFLSPNLSEHDKKFLSSSQCGYNNRNVLICCPDRHRNDDVTVTPATTQPSTNQLLPAPGECGNVLSNRIYGGNLTKIDEFPWMALIEYTKDEGAKGHHCGGSLINSRYVVTASHCVNGAGLPTHWKLSGVRLGEWDTTTNPDCEYDVRGEKDCAPPHLDVAVESTIPHPLYVPTSKSQMHDIALLRLSRNVEYTDFVRPICLPVNPNLRTVTFDEIVMDVAGWGKTETASTSTMKLKAAVKGVNLGACNQVYRSTGIQLEKTQLCAGGEEGVDSCRGDSGGPLVTLDTTNKVRVNYFLAGIVSFGPTPCGLSGWPGVYTRVGDYVDWIEQTITA